MPAVLTPMLAAAGIALSVGGEPTWLGLAAVGLLAGLLTLDDTALAQTWLSCPLVAGIAAGALCGDPAVGLAIGLPMQLALAGNLPVGQTLTGDPAPAVVAVVAAVALGETQLTPVLSGGGAVDLPLLGWCILAVGLLSLAGHLLIQTERRAHVLWMLEGHRTLRDGSLTRVERIHARCMLATLLRGAIFGVLFMLAVLRLWLPLFDLLPQHVVRALGLVPLLVPALGLGMLIDRYGPRTAWPWVLSGAVVAGGLSLLVG